MQEYRDGTFGEPMEANEMMKKLVEDPGELARTKAIHIGTLQELENQKMTSGNAKRIMNKLEQLERKLNRVIIHLGVGLPGEILVVDGRPDEIK